MPVAGFGIEMIACAKEFALGEDEVFDVIDKMFLASPQPLDNIDSASSASYYLSPTKGLTVTQTCPFASRTF